MIRENSIDAAFAAFCEFSKSIEDLLDNHYSETDTRVKFVDPLLTTVLGWDEHANIKREEQHTDIADQRCVDYVLSQREPDLVVEAKRVLVDFEIPTVADRVDYSLKGVVTTWANAWKAILQAQQYCVDVGARYALVTNGRQFIGFKAVSERGSWKDGHFIAFSSLKVLENNFNIFYECFSRECISRDRLADFARDPAPMPHSTRPRTELGIQSGGFRNDLQDILDDAFREILLDASHRSTEFLRECYCTSKDASQFRSRLNSLLVDPLPIFREPIHEVRPGRRGDPFAKKFASLLDKQKTRPLVVVMGGTGSGKSYFLDWYMTLHLPKPIEDKSVIAKCDFRILECTENELHDLTLRELTTHLLDLTAGLTASFAQQKEMFRKQVTLAKQGWLQPWAGDEVELDRRIADYIKELQTFDAAHLRILLHFLEVQCDRRVVLILDNMDQKSDAMQETLYQTAQELALGTPALVVLVLREATCHRLSRIRQGDAFSQLHFHVRAQPIGGILQRRITYLEQRLSGKHATLQSATGKTFDVTDVHRFLQLMARSLYEEQADPRILECIQAISNGNIREQLAMVHSFLVSGQTKIDEYFSSYAADATRRIPFHEVLHSIILEDRRIFDETYDRRFVNIFEMCGSPVDSHFTGLRILHYLSAGLGQEGDLKPADYVSIEQVAEEFILQGIGLPELEHYIRRFCQFGLLMPQSQEPTALFLEEPFALTKCGEYYLKNLYYEFPYFGAMALDTGIKDEDVASKCVSIARGQLHAKKMAVKSRLEIAQVFVDYLEACESQELSRGAVAKSSIFGAERFVNRMANSLTTIRNALAGSSRRT